MTRRVLFASLLAWWPFRRPKPVVRTGVRIYSQGTPESTTILDADGRELSHPMSHLMRHVTRITWTMDAGEKVAKCTVELAPGAPYVAVAVDTPGGSTRSVDAAEVPLLARGDLIPGTAAEIRRKALQVIKHGNDLLVVADRVTAIEDEEVRLGHWARAAAQ